MTPINKEICESISDDVAAALAKVAEKHGLKLSVGGGSFTTGEFKPKVRFYSEEGEAEVAKAEFERFAESLFGLKPSDFGRQFTLSGGQQFTITGLTSGRSSKWEIRGKEVATGKPFRFTSRSVRIALGYPAEME